MADLARLAEESNLVFVVVSLLAAGFVLAGGARKPVNAALAAYLAAPALGTIDAIPLLSGVLLGDPEVSRIVTLAVLGIGYASLPIALLFFSLGIDARALKPLRRPAARALLAALAAAAFAAPFALQTRMLEGTPAGYYAGHAWIATPLANATTDAALLATYVLSLLFGLLALREAPAGSASRARARAYAIAFGLIDASWLLVAIPAAAGAEGAIALLASNALFLVAVVLLMRALLREQLFDFDLKLKWTLRRGTLVGAFVAAFFIVSAIAEQYLQQRYGLVVGGIAVGLMLFLMRPLEKVADRFAEAAMPRVQDTAEYRTVRKREVYRAAVESALADGSITDKERGMLATLADHLGLGVRETLEIERSALTTRAAIPA